MPIPKGTKLSGYKKIPPIIIEQLMYKKGLECISKFLEEHKITGTVLQFQQRLGSKIDNLNDQSQTQQDIEIRRTKSRER